MSKDFGYPHTSWNREEKQTARRWLLTALHGDNPDVNAWILIAIVSAMFTGIYLAF